MGGDVETVTINAADDTTITLSNANNTNISSITGSGAGDITYVVDYDLSEIALTGSAADDIFDISAGALGANDTVDGGDGTDKLLYAAAADTTSVAGTDDSTTISNVEVLELQSDDNGGAGANDFTIDLDTTEGITSIEIDANDTAQAAVVTLNDATATQLSAISLTGDEGGGVTITLDAKDGTGDADSATITAALGTGDGTLTIADSNNNLESLTITANGDANQTIAITDGDFTGDNDNDATLTISGGAAARTMTITGSLSSDTVDLSGVASDTTVTLATGIDHTFTGGTGDDEVTMTTGFASTDVIDGGDGTDTLILAPSSSIARPGTVSNVEKLQFGATAGVTVAGANITGVTELILSNAAGLNDNVVTLQNLKGVTTITH